VITPASSAGTNYQVRVKTFYSELKEEHIVPTAQVVSTLPTPSGTAIISAQAAVFWDGTSLHIWFASSTNRQAINDDIYCTKATSPFTSWNTPVKVIDSAYGVRDPTVFIEGNTIYLFCQSYDGTRYRPIRLYKILKTANFANPTSYIYVGEVIDVGAEGSFDAERVASPCVVKINNTYYLMYEALSAPEPNGIFSIGRAKTTSIESLPWTKDGQLRDTGGNVIYNPTGNTNPIVPDTFADSDTLYIHYRRGAAGPDEVWSTRYINGDFPSNSLTLSGKDIDPSDGYRSHNNIAHIGFINGLYMFLMQSWDTTTYLRLYRQSNAVAFLNGHCRADFGDVRFTDDDGTTLLDYWMESKVDGDYAIFWVEVADDLSTNPATIYIYYGKSDATTTSNGENTFPFFDDFLGLSVDQDKWHINGQPTVSDSVLTLHGRGSDEESDQIRSKTSFAQGSFRAHSRFRLNSGDGCGLFWGDDDFSWDNGDGGIGAGVNTPNFFVDKNLGGGRIQTSLSRDTSYHIFELLAYSQTIMRGWIDGSYQTNSGAGGTQNNYFVLLRAWTWTYDGIGGFDWVFVRKYVDPEPGHGGWGSEETGEYEYVIIDQAFVSDERADVGSVQTVGFHAKWANGSDVIGGSIYVNGTEHIANSTGWVSFPVTSPIVRKQQWTVTSVNCSGITTYMQTVQNPSIIWDQIQITNGGTIKKSSILGETATIWFQALYEYDNDIFDNTNGDLYVNGSKMSWSTTNNRWEYYYTPTAPGSKTFIISKVYDSSYGLTAINDTAGAQTINVLFSPFSIISNSTITELSFNSTTKIISFRVSGPPRTTGFTNVTIAKTLIANISTLKVYLDGSEITYTTFDIDYYWLIHFTYNHSTHKVVIYLSSSNTDLPHRVPLETIITLSGIAIAIIAITPPVRKKLRKKIP
jgi:hypothetical protein